MEVGHQQKLKVLRFRPIGAILTGNILLPKKEVPEDCHEGSELEVFVYTDSEDRVIATTRKPKLELGGLAVLRVVAQTKIGAFLDWGLEKDLFLPKGEQVGKIKLDDLILVACYQDAMGRLAATCKVRPYFKKPDTLKENDRLRAQVYATHPEFGAYCLVEGKYNGLIAPDQRNGILKIGEEVTCRLTHMKPDGKLDLSMKAQAYQRLDEDAGIIYRTLSANHGFLRVNDHTDPEAIKMLFGLSKGQFKRALGRLLKNGSVVFLEDGIALGRDRHDRK